MNKYEDHARQLKSLLSAFKMGDIEVISKGKFCTVYVEDLPKVKVIGDLIAQINLYPYEVFKANFRKGKYLFYQF